MRGGGGGKEEEEEEEEEEKQINYRQIMTGCNLFCLALFYSTFLNTDGIQSANFAMTTVLKTTIQWY